MDQISLQNQLLAGLTVNPTEEARAELANLPAAAWAQLFDLASAQGVLPLVWQRLKSQGLLALIPADEQAQRQKQIYAKTVRNLRLYRELGIILARLREQQIPVIILKGAYLAATVYSNPALRMMNDIDLLFAPADLPAVVETLSELGYHPAYALGLDDLAPIGHHLPRFGKPDAVVGVEVHWTITKPGKSYTIDMAELWARAVPVKIAGVDVLAFCPEDLLLHICEHATYQHLFIQGIRFLCDIDAIVRHTAADMNWARVQQQAHRWGWAKGVYLALQLAQTLLATPIPAATLNALRPTGNHEQLIHAAVGEIFAKKISTDAVSSEFVRLWGDQRFGAKVRRLLHSAFLPRAVMTSLYPATSGSLQLYLYYPVRIKDLFVHYGGKIWQQWWRDPKMTRVVRRRQALLDWLE